MLQSYAREILQDLRKACQTPSGYEYADKHKFGHLLNNLEVQFSDSTHRTFDEKKFTEVRAIIHDWQKQRLSADGGAAGIHDIIRRVEALIPELPRELPPPKNVDLSHLARNYRDHFIPS
jgi:hypothetical protein